MYIESVCVALKYTADVIAYLNGLLTKAKTILFFIVIIFMFACTMLCYS